LAEDAAEVRKVSFETSCDSIVSGILRIGMELSKLLEYFDPVTCRRYLNFVGSTVVVDYGLGASRDFVSVPRTDNSFHVIP
jgi:hypothetical protein